MKIYNPLENILHPLKTVRQENAYCASLTRPVQTPGSDSFTTQSMISRHAQNGNEYDDF